MYSSRARVVQFMRDWHLLKILGVLAIIGIIWILFFSGDGSGYDGPDDGFEDFDDDY